MFLSQMATEILKRVCVGFDPLNQLCVGWSEWKKIRNQLKTSRSNSPISWPTSGHCRKRCVRHNFVLIIPNNNSFRNHHCSLLPKYYPAVSIATTTTAVCMKYCIEHPSPSSRWWKVRFKLEQATKAKWTSICISIFFL